MTPALLALLFTGIEEAIKQAPAIAQDIGNIFSAGTPTAEQWAALRAKYASENYSQFVPNSDLPPTP